ncbi:4-(cytidine 5'-diphospho)-2-C-methyl-D-erythritol kinase [Wenzhouxiangella sp. XN24]|uniref:4-(cytidine 5'-diphospho)-2-C-methyl-D-erythritol kinase n=1 Tax=Wenzhouxiangella sp. XN24 TaxID=2713569 RepID=UPI0013EBDFE9|nr:4-(cytidine 5'-diphospho)-2-C-methyl-D-erythritol kinase [Wenzhouxiangella sp. XN24]NGX15764.1 4-(cytidine 5'-diphospho)-2-C-methyl-D-erythritol kinase [Wenzhouxiangella sp. XN24]
MSRCWPAPAKLNLFLQVTGRRPDGYHDLQTVFQLLDFGDDIFLETTSDGVISRPEGLAAVAPEDDLAVRAARRLQAACGTRQGAEIRIRKRIPAGGGLGGGSSDAATVLVGLNHLWGLGWPVERLAALGLELGADVPVFIHGRSAWAEGVGERLIPVTLPPACFAVICPDCFVSTAAVFADPELTRDSAETTIHGFLSSGGRNDCEPVVRRRYPAVAAALDWLGARSGARARLTGTGGCVFAQFAALADAREALADLPREWTGFVARGLDESPLLARAGGQVAPVA